LETSAAGGINFDNIRVFAYPRQYSESAGRMLVTAHAAEQPDGDWLARHLIKFTKLRAA
jgi:hypothetical protein